MMRTKHIALIVGLALVASAGIAAATYASKSVWGGNNPGQGGDHAEMPDIAAEHNKAGANHPSPDHNQTHPNDGNETDDSDNGASEGNETGDGAPCQGNGTAPGGQPEDVPPAHAQDGQPENGKPADVPPAHSCAHTSAPPSA
jgi:hypothetical protein